LVSLLRFSPAVPTQQRQDALVTLQAAERGSPASLVEINFDWHPAVGGLLGVGLLIFLVGERLVKGRNLY